MPAAVVDLDGVTQLAVGSYATCTLPREGQVACWGINAYGQLGDGRAHDVCDVSRHTTDAHGTVDCSARPVAVTLARATKIALGSTGACATLSDGGGVACWGNVPGDDAERRPVPIHLPWARDAVDVSVGEWHACALERSGRVTCWGPPAALGHARSSKRLCPARYAGCAVGDPLPPAAGRVVRLSAGHTQTCVVNVSGALRCW